MVIYMKKNKAVYNMKKIAFIVFAVGVVFSVIFLIFQHSKAALAKTEFGNSEDMNESSLQEKTDFPSMTSVQSASDKLDSSFDIREHYYTHVGDPSNLYYIDDDNILWGSGKNEYGQLGQSPDYDFHSEMVKIAENVIHVDYSQKGFIVFLTKDYKLYGLGNAGCGALQQYEKFDADRYVNDKGYYVSEPYLLMENVKYACCGRDDIACLSQDGDVWIWGTVGVAGTVSASESSYSVYYIEKPKKVLDGALIVTGGWFNHAALLQNGTVWTWGYNEAGNCGIDEGTIISKPTMVAENVVMVWTNRSVPNYPQPSSQDIAMGLTGRLAYNTDYNDIAELDEVYPKFLNNTVIQKSDGSYWACGENIGNEKKTIQGSEGNYPVICTYEFLQCE